MNILIVGKGAKESIRKWGHQFLFVNTPKSTEEAPALSGFHLALFHLSEDCTVEDGRFARVLDTWKLKGGIQKVIAISGGALTSDRARRLSDLGNVPFIGGIENADMVLQLDWQSVSSVDAANTRLIARMLIKQRNEPYLIALLILCQGYLAARGRFDVLLGTPQRPGFANRLSNKAPSDVLRTSWWSKPFAAERETNAQAIDLRSAIGREHKRVANLVDKILGSSDLTEKDDEIVISAFIELKELALHQ